MFNESYGDKYLIMINIYLLIIINKYMNEYIYKLKFLILEGANL
jgi:hypothetical protein